MHDSPMEVADDAVSSRERIWLAAEQLRLTAVALHAMAATVDTSDDEVVDQIERLVHRSAELMRAASRLGTSLDVSSAWGMDLLFRAAADTPVAVSAGRPSGAMPPIKMPVKVVEPVEDPMNGSVELAPIELLPPEVELPLSPRRLSLPRAAMAVPPPPLARMKHATQPARLALAPC